MQNTKLKILEDSIQEKIYVTFSFVMTLYKIIMAQSMEEKN
jgi:hypothetical protein